MKPGIALITGCSSGIGRELAQQLAQLGWTVYAGARNPESVQALASERLIPLQLDVNAPEQLAQCFARLEQEAGRLDLLVNNAGYGAMGPVVEMPLEQVRRQFETNVFAPLALTQAMLPLLQQSEQGRVVNMGSISGIVTTPFSGAYCATKAALHSLSDALRMELAPFGIQVVTIQPGAIQSEFGNNAERSLAATLPADSRYQTLRPYIDARARASQQNGTPTAKFVQELIKAITLDPPPPERRIGNGSTLLPLLKRVLPTRLLDRVLSRKFGLNARF
jgi:NAD(P)-dependent dehydrogenase (short-subunit alcohol dehydrogenase family)